MECRMWMCSSLSGPIRLTRLKDIYEKLFVGAEQRLVPASAECVRGVTVNGTRGDLVPGKVQAGYQNYHSLYLRKRDSWTQTNVGLHADTVHSSGRLKEIRAVKIWRMLHGLDFPSLYLELFTIRSLSGGLGLNARPRMFFTP